MLQQVTEGQTFTALITHANSQWITAKIIENGLDATISVKKISNQFNHVDFSHSTNEQKINLGDTINIKIARVNACQLQLEATLTGS